MGNDWWSVDKSTLFVVPELNSGSIDKVGETSVDKVHNALNDNGHAGLIDMVYDLPNLLAPCQKPRTIARMLGADDWVLWRMTCK